MGETKHDGLAVPGRVVLAYEPQFALGPLCVDPPTRQITCNGRNETLEPRVMQVLVALARADGAIVTRDELIERCWDRRIVTDDAINRVISRIRHVAEDIGVGSLKVETITKVGYRLVEQPADELRTVTFPSLRFSQTMQGAAVSRRGVIAGAGAAAVVLSAGALFWTKAWRHRPVAEADQLYRRGALLMREGLPGQVRQSIAYYERAVAIDPEYADAWGALALSYSHLLEGYDPSEVASLPGRIRSAARRALALDRGNADAQLALIFTTPNFRNWASKEVELRRVVDRHPRHWLAHGRLAILLYQVGRLSEGMDLHRRALEIEPMLPVSHFFIIKNLSALGRPQETEAAIDKARERWPAHPMLWAAKFDHLVFSGRPKAAAAFVVEPDSLPSGFGPAQIDRRLRLARALDTWQPTDIEASVDDHRKLALEDVAFIPVAAKVFAALGHPDLTFASLERYYFNRGPFGAPSPIGRYLRPHTDDLYSSPMMALRTDSRFARLLREIGLEAYWRQTRTVPDFRRAI
jgi:DNA-binding winged helix-turn-helix (wHTH) protein